MSSNKEDPLLRIPRYTLNLTSRLQNDVIGAHMCVQRVQHSSSISVECNFCIQARRVLV